jgi:hypothetical protein
MCYRASITVVVDKDLSLVAWVDESAFGVTIIGNDAELHAHGAQAAAGERECDCECSGGDERQRVGDPGVDTTMLGEGL